MTATAIEQVRVELPNRQQIWLPVESRGVQVGAKVSLGIRPEHLLPSDNADVTPEGEVRVVEQLGTKHHIQIPAIRQNPAYRQNDVVLVEEGATFAIGLHAVMRMAAHVVVRIKSRVFKAHKNETQNQ